MGKDTFYGLPASLRGHLFRDADFAELYCLDNGRISVPPSLLATALLLQTHDKVSGSEAKARADFDIRWKVALGVEIEDRPLAKSTLQVFRAQLISHDKVREVFEQSLRLAREAGYLKGKRGMRVATDTTYILGRGGRNLPLLSVKGQAVCHDGSLTTTVYDGVAGLVKAAIGTWSVWHNELFHFLQSMAIGGEMMSRHMTVLVCATMISAGVVIFALLWVEIPRRWEPSLLAGVPAFVSLLVALAPRAWRHWRPTECVCIGHLPGPFPALFAVRQVWGPSLDSFKKTVSLAKQRIDDAQERLGSAMQNQETPLNQIFWMGYKAIQTASAIHVLCENGYADQAYAKCRELMEFEANIFFIMTSGDPTETSKRYSDWSLARFHKYVSENKSSLAISSDEWTELDEAYQIIKEEYARKGENVHKKERWAIAWREKGTKKIEAFSVRQRAEHSMPYLKREPYLIHEVWKSRWYHANEAIHNDPRVLMASLSSPAENVVVTGSSNIGLREPIREAALMILNISSVISHNIPAKQTEASDTLGNKTMEASTTTLKLLRDVPIRVNPWWLRQVQDAWKS